MADGNLNLGEILAAAEAGTPREHFLAKLANIKEEDPKETPMPEKVASKNLTNDEEKEIEIMEKIAGQMDEQGRIMARAFVDEINKIAVGTQVMDTPPGPGVSNAAMQLSATEHSPVGTDVTGRVSAVINQLKASTEAGVGEIGQSGTVIDRPPRPPVQEGAPVLADLGKTAGLDGLTDGDWVLTNLFNRHIEG